MSHAPTSFVRPILCLLVFSYAAGSIYDNPICAETDRISSSPLADAVEDENWKQVSALLAQKVDPNQKQVDGTTALHWAVYHDNDSAVKQLLQAKADVMATNRYGVAPLSLACTNGNAEVIQLLLSAGADVNTTLRGGETALMTAARTGRVEAVKVLLKHDADVKRTEHKGQSAIMWAAAEGHVQVVDELIKAGADFRRRLKSGFTPFFFAVRGGHIEVVQNLLEAGIDVNDTLTTEMRGGKRPRNNMSPLILAVENGHFELAVILLKAGADANDQRSGYTPLHAITWSRKPSRGGDGPDGDPAPVGSGDITSLQFVRLLEKHGADVNARLKRGSSGRARLNLTGATPFLMAAKTADIPLLILLIELGADTTITNVDNCTPLMAAAGIGTIAPTEEAGTEEEALKTIGILLKLGADVNAVDKNGETAMHGAAYKSLPKVAWLLQENGANIKTWNKKNKYGWTPLLIAEGHRQGNFKPSFETIEAIHGIMRANGLTPPPPTPRERRKGYDQD